MISERCTFSTDSLVVFVGGDLPPDEELTMAEHLGGCEPCSARAAELVTLRSALSECCATDIVRWHQFPTPFGDMFVAATDRGLARVSWRQEGDEPGSWTPQDADTFVEEMERSSPEIQIVRDARRLSDVERELGEYFAGIRSRFDVAIDLNGLSHFDRQVLDAARAIPFGEVIPYAELARRIAKPGAARAVGNALGRNPVAIVVPCHRVIRTDGSLSGYGGGVEYKERLLGLERGDLLFAS